MVNDMARRRTEKVGQQKGFTLVELLVVVSILALMAVLGTVRLIERSERRVADTVISDLLSISYAAQAYASNHYGQWPFQSDKNCGDALKLLTSTSTPYLGGSFVTPWNTDLTAADFSYETSCPGTVGQKEVFIIKVKVPAKHLAYMKYKVPSSEVTYLGSNGEPLTDPDLFASARWGYITHRLPLPRYNTGIHMNEIKAVDSITGELKIDIPSCKKPRISVQPLMLCSVNYVNKSGAPVQADHIRGYFSDITPNEKDLWKAIANNTNNFTQWTVKLYVKTHQNDLVQVRACDHSKGNWGGSSSEPILFNVLVHCP